MRRKMSTKSTASPKTKKVRAKSPSKPTRPIKKKVATSSKKEEIQSVESTPGAPKTKIKFSGRQKKLHGILLAKRYSILREMKEQLGQSLNEEQYRRLESAKDSGDQALVGLEREMGISLQEMRNKERQLIENALTRLEEGSYGLCADCGEEISEKRLAALPFATLCVECQSKQELLEKIERGEQRA